MLHIPCDHTHSKLFLQTYLTNVWEYDASKWHLSMAQINTFDELKFKIIITILSQLKRFRLFINTLGVNLLYLKIVVFIKSVHSSKKLYSHCSFSFAPECVFFQRWFSFKTFSFPSFVLSRRVTICQQTYSARYGWIKWCRSFPHVQHTTKSNQFDQYPPYRLFYFDKIYF